jgi:hypothetical protein
MEQLQIINSTDALQAITRQEIDLAITTAKAYPRDMEKARGEILHYATVSQETAEQCFFALPRKDKKGNIKMIEGKSIRFAEIVMSNWGNVRSGSRVVSNDGKIITSQGVCHDLERNVYAVKEASRRITDSEGRTYSEDMQIMTANAAASIALRNAVFTVIPEAYYADLLKQIKQFALGKTKKEDKKFTERRDKIMQSFKDAASEAGFELKDEQILALVRAKKPDDIDLDKAFTLLGVLNAINEGTAYIETVFGIQKTQVENKDFSDDTSADDAKEGSGELPLK